MSFLKALSSLVLCCVLVLLSACKSNEKNNSFLAPDNDKEAIRVAVTGQVPQPGYYTVSANANIATVLVQAGWTPYFAKDTYETSPSIWIKRLGEGKQDSWIFQMDELYDQKWMDFQLQDGDIINVIIILF